MSRPRTTFLEWLQEVVSRQNIAQALSQEHPGMVDDIKTMDPDALARYRGQAGALESWDQPEKGDIVDMGPTMRLSPDKYVRVMEAEGQNAIVLYKGKKISLPFKNLYEVRRTSEGAFWIRLTQRQADKTYFNKARMAERESELERRRMMNVPQQSGDVSRSTALLDLLTGKGAPAAAAEAPGESPLDALLRRGRAA